MVGIPPASRALRRLPAPVLRRDAPASDDRDGPGAGSRTDHRRRADDRTGRHRPGSGPRAACEAPGRARHLADPHHPRPRASSPMWPTRSWSMYAEPAGRDRPTGATPTTKAHHPYTQRAAAFDPGRGAGRRSVAGDPGPAAEHAEEPAGLLVRSALPGSLRPLRHRRSRRSAPSAAISSIVQPAGWRFAPSPKPAGRPLPIRPRATSPSRQRPDPAGRPRESRSPATQPNR